MTRRSTTPTCEAEKLEVRQARIDRVVLDYELKRDYQRWLHEHPRDGWCFGGA
jgi:hypothetical protein